MLYVDVGISALQASQQALYAISNNIANANTEGYHRQRVELSDRHPVTIGPLQIGSGVEVSQVSRLRDTATEGALISNNSLKAESQAYLKVLEQLESVFLPTAGSLNDVVTDFFNKVEQLAAQPSTVTIRDSVISAAQAVVQQINLIDSRLNHLQTNNAIEIGEEVDAINAFTRQIAALNLDIRIATKSGQQPNTLLDQRDRLISQLSESVDLSLQSVLVEASPIVALNGSVIIAESATQIVASTNPDGHASVKTQQGGHNITPNSGRLAGLFAGQTAIEEIQQELHNWANEFVSAIDAIHATGLGQNQQTSLIEGTRTLSATATPLAGVESSFPIESGELSLTITQSSTGVRTTHQIAVDTSVDTLTDVISRLDAIPGVSALIQPDTQHVQLKVGPGYTIDFAGRIDPSPTSSTLTGTAVPELRGLPAGNLNRDWTATIVGTGDIGVTPGLSLEVRDSVSGSLITTSNLGEGYLPGEAINLGAGVEVIFSTGSVNHGEQFSFDLISQPDETGLLVALGLGTLFGGDASTGLSISPAVLDSPLNFPASRTGAAADSSNLARLIQLRDQPAFNSRNETLEERLVSLSTAQAFRIESERSTLDYVNQQQTHLLNVRDSVSGVDPNEEFLQMLAFQRQFQAASRFVTVIDEALEQLMNLIG